MKTPCMMTELLVALDTLDESKAIAVRQQDKLIGVVSTAALEGVKTVRLTFTRASSDQDFSPVQAQAIEAFGDFSDGVSADDEI